MSVYFSVNLGRDDLPSLNRVCWSPLLVLLGRIEKVKESKRNLSLPHVLGNNQSNASRKCYKQGMRAMGLPAVTIQRQVSVHVINPQALYHVPHAVRYGVPLMVQLARERRTVRTLCF